MLAVASACGERLFDFVVPSENYPDPYPMNHMSTQVLTVASFQTVKIEIIDFEVEDSNVTSGRDVHGNTDAHGNTDVHGNPDAPCANDWMKVSAWQH